MPRKPTIQVKRVHIDEWGSLPDSATYLVTEGGKRLAHIWTFRFGEELEVSHIQDLEHGGPRKLGPARIRQIARILSELNPGIRYIVGEGISDPRGVGSGLPREFKVDRL